MISVNNFSHQYFSAGLCLSNFYLDKNKMTARVYTFMTDLGSFMYALLDMYILKIFLLKYVRYFLCFLLICHLKSLIFGQLNPSDISLIVKSFTARLTTLPYGLDSNVTQLLANMLTKPTVFYYLPTVPCNLVSIKLLLL